LNRTNLETLFSEGYELCREQGVYLPPEDQRQAVLDVARDSFSGEYAENFASACLAFYLFQDLHGRVYEAPAATTLLGDYFFSRFSKHLIPIDSVPLIDAFSEYLAQCASGDKEDYLAFIKSISGVLAA
jgi:hypothetical protein